MGTKLFAGANFRINTQTLDLEPFFANGNATARGATFFRIEIAPGTFTDFKGSFKYSSAGELVSGTITQIKHYSAGLVGFVMSGISLPVQSFLDAAKDPRKGYPANVWHNVIDVPQIKGSNKGDVLIGNWTYGNFIDGKGGADIMRGAVFEGNDRYVVDVAADRVIDGKDELGGTDTVYAKTSYALREEAGWIEVLKVISATSTNAMNLYGNDYGNTVQGNNGRNILRGNGGDDKLLGLGGDDILIGGRGSDLLIGGRGRDAFVFEAGLTPDGSDVDAIRDFNVADDHIRLENSIFTALATTGTLDASAFVVGTAATTPDQHIVYNSTAGRLYYDADGSGAGEASLFATLGTNLALSHTHFLVI